jgi:DNA-binding transcriptional MerR regulator
MEGRRHHLRIGELSRRAGVSPDLLRAWESRYGLLRPARSPGGFRLYATDDEERVRAMQQHMARGVSAAQAARLVLDADPGATTPASPPLAAAAANLRDALDAYDDTRANDAFDRLLATFRVETVLGEVVLPYLRELGQRWERGDASVAQEHFASNLLRGRLLGLGREWGRGPGFPALLACAPGEQHDLPLIAFGLALRDRGVRVAFLGADTPLDTLVAAAGALRPAIVVVSATSTRRFRAALPGLAELARSWPVAIAGPGATVALAGEAGTERLGGDPISEAERVARRLTGEGDRPAATRRAPAGGRP